MELRRLDVGDRSEALRAHADLVREGFGLLPTLLPGMPWKDYLEQLGRLERGAGPPSRVPETNLVGDVDGTIVGRLTIRHHLDRYLLDVAGHIGYAVRPRYRRRGHATEMLRQSLPVARGLGLEAVLVTCDTTNTASAKVIEACGGELEDIRTSTGGRPKRRYWIRTG